MRTFLAWTAVYLAFAAFLGHGIYGLYLDLKLGRYRLEVPPRRDRSTPAYYGPGAEPWLATNRRWQRWLTPVWLGCILAGNLLYWVLKR